MFSARVGDAHSGDAPVSSLSGPWAGRLGARSWEPWGSELAASMSILDKCIAKDAWRTSAFFPLGALGWTIWGSELGALGLGAGSLEVDF